MNLTIQNMLMRMNRTYVRMAFLAVAAIMSVSILVAQAVAPTTMYTVGASQTYTTIQAAVDAASAGDIIQIEAGTYNENVTIGKTLKIVGAGATTIIEGTTPTVKAGNGITISNSITDVEISDLVVQNFTSGSGIKAGTNANGINIHDVKVDNNGATSAGTVGGIYIAGPVNGVTIQNVIASNNTAPAKARGIVIWDGFKQNITITDNTVTGNDCCGIELQDGTASGVNISRNTITGNTDNGIGATGLMGGAGENIIADNIITNNGRFGIEIKMPNGTGAESGDGSIVVSGNTVTGTTIGDVRDMAGIAVFRRGMLAANSYNNADIPKGVVVKNNTVSGFTQASTSEGFGIVVEGLSMTVYGNTLSGNDVDLQQQSGHNNYNANTSGDGDQSNLADQYFGRGNSPVVCANFHDNSGATPRSVGTVGTIAVENTTKAVSFCSIQSAIDDVVTTAGNVITVQAGTYSELLNVNKPIELTTNGAVTLTSPASGSDNKIINVTAADVSIHGFNIVLNRPYAQRAISATNANNLKVYANTISSTGTGATWPRIGIYVDQTAGSGNTASIYGNTIYGTDANTPFEGRGISTHQIHGVIGGDDALTDKNTVYAWFDVTNQFNSGGTLSIKNNEFQGGGIDLTEPNTGPVTIEENTFAPKITGINTQTLLVKNVSSAPVVVKNNTFTGYKVAINNANSTDVTIEGNAFNPTTALSNFTDVVVTNKVITSGAIAPRAMNLTFIKNAFNGNGSAGGTGVAFLNHNATGATYGTVSFGGDVATKNTFASTLANYIVLDGQTFADSQAQTATYPEYASSNGASSTVGAPYAGNITALLNDFGGLTDSAQIETHLVHQIDNAALGLITFAPLNNDSTLNTLTVDAGTLVPVFTPGTLNYSVVLPTGTTAVPTVSAMATASESTVTITQAPSLPGTATVVVTAQDESEKTYTIVFTVAAAPVPTTSASSGSGGGYSTPNTQTIGNTDTGSGQGTQNTGNTNSNTGSNTGSGSTNTNGTGGGGSSTGSGMTFTDVNGHWGEEYITKLAEKCGLTGYKDGEGNLLGEFRPDEYIARSELAQMLFGCDGKKVPMNTELSGRPFSDVNPEWFDLAVRVGKAKGWIEGYADNTFRPYDITNRAEALKLILRTEYSDMDIHSGLSDVFSDVSSDEWYARYIHFAYEMGIVNGYKDSQGNSLGVFFPNNKLTRAEAAKMIVLIKGY